MGTVTQLSDLADRSPTAHRPKVQIYRRLLDVEGGQVERITGVCVDGVLWPVVSVTADWESRGSTLITMSLHGVLEVLEGDPHRDGLRAEDAAAFPEPAPA